MKGKNQIIVGVLALLIGLLLALQMKTTTGEGEYKGGMISLAQAQSSAAELTRVKNEKELLLQELQALEEKIKEIEAEEAEDNAFLKNRLEELDKYRMVAGVVEVQGPGIIIQIDEPQAEPGLHGDSIITYNYELLLLLANKLREAGAEAISINGQRITAFSEISLAGSNININGEPTAPPYEVKAIGKADTLESTISIRYGVLYTMRNDYGLTVSVTKEDNIVIPRYKNMIAFEYAQGASE